METFFFFKSAGGSKNVQRQRHKYQQVNLTVVVLVHNEAACICSQDTEARVFLPVSLPLLKLSTTNALPSLPAVCGQPRHLWSKAQCPLKMNLNA